VCSLASAAKIVLAQAAKFHLGDAGPKPASELLIVYEPPFGSKIRSIEVPNTSAILNASGRLGSCHQRSGAHPPANHAARMAGVSAAIAA
jgi:predicted RNA methylase